MREFAIPCGLALACLMAAQSAMGQKPDPAEAAVAIAAIRDYAVNYTASLPNFTCTLVVRHTTTPARRTPFPLGMKATDDVIEDQLSFVDRREVHQVLRINGAAPKSEEERKQAVSSWGEFGNLLNSVMDPATGAELKVDRIATLNGKKVYVVAYFIDAANGYGIIGDSRTMRAAYHGLIYADYNTKAVARITADIGPIADYQQMDLTLDYKPIQVAGREFLLPSHYVLHIRKPEGEMLNTSDYKSYKRFGTESTLSFEAEPEDAPQQR